jgi:hypothetical protein
VNLCGLLDGGACARILTLQTRKNDQLQARHTMQNTRAGGKVQCAAFCCGMAMAAVLLHCMGVMH